MEKDNQKSWENWVVTVWEKKLSQEAICSVKIGLVAQVGNARENWLARVRQNAVSISYFRM